MHRKCMLAARSHEVELCGKAADSHWFQLPNNSVPRKWTVLGLNIKYNALRFLLLFMWLSLLCCHAACESDGQRERCCILIIFRTHKSFISLFSLNVPVLCMQNDFLFHFTGKPLNINWLFFFPKHKKETWRSLQPNNWLCSFKCPRKPRGIHCTQHRNSAPLRMHAASPLCVLISSEFIAAAQH